MARGARSIEVEDDCGDIVDVTLWVNADEELKISVHTDDDESLDLGTAVDVADAIKALELWSRSEEGKRRIKAMAKREQEDDDARMKRLAAKRKAHT